MITKIALSGSALVLAFIIVAFAPPISGEDHHEHDRARPAGSPGHDPLKEEMVKLDGVFREVVSAVAVGDGKRVHHALEAMHGTMERTHEGVHEGNVSIPKNADRIGEFVDLDKRFHAKLDKLAGAAERNDGQAMAGLTKELLDGCIQCHEIFRNP